MSLAITEKITCPACGVESDTTIWTSVNADLNPDLKARLLDGSIFVFTCPACGVQTPLEQEMLYHDMERRTMIQLSAPGQPPPDMSPLKSLLALHPKSVYTLRLVRSREALIEKIRILDAGLDDRVVEPFKSMLAERLSEKGFSVREIRFLRKSETAPDKAAWQVRSAVEEREIETEFREPYSEMRRALRQALAAQNSGMEWREVDAGYFDKLADSGVLDNESLNG